MKKLILLSILFIIGCEETTEPEADTTAPIYGDWILNKVIYWDEDYWDEDASYSPDCYDGQQFLATPQYTNSISFTDEYKDAYFFNWPSSSLELNLSAGYHYTLDAYHTLDDGKHYTGVGTYLLEDDDEICVNTYVGTSDGNTIVGFNGCFFYEIHADTLIMKIDDNPEIEGTQTGAPWNPVIFTGNHKTCNHLYFIKDDD